MEKMYVLYLQYFDYETQIEFIASSETKELLYGKVYDWFRSHNYDIPDDDAEAEKYLEEDEDIRGWWDDRRTNFNFYDACMGESDFWIEEVEFLK
jgi:hypothetical protein